MPSPAASVSRRSWHQTSDGNLIDGLPCERSSLLLSKRTPIGLHSSSGIVAFGESFVFLSLLFPGTAMLIASGALVRGWYPRSFLAGAWRESSAPSLETRSRSGWVGHSDPKFRMCGRFDIIRNDWKVGSVFFERYGTASVFIGRSLDRSAL